MLYHDTDLDFKLLVLQMYRVRNPVNKKVLFCWSIKDLFPKKQDGLTVLLFELVDLLLMGVFCRNSFTESIN